MAALGQLGLPTTPVDTGADAAVPNGGNDEDRKTTVDGGDRRAARLPRWTRQEILVLIQGKKVAENRVRRGRTVGVGPGEVEPKWVSVSSYCKRHGVNRGPVQCRKRWSNLAGDYKKIKEWESQVSREEESFWAMRNDLRRERKLPGFFDREVYDILDCGMTAAAPATPTGLGLAEDAKEVAEEEIEAQAVFDNGRSATADGGLFSEFDQSFQEEEIGGGNHSKTSVPHPVPISEKQYQPFSEGCPTSQGATHGKRQTSDPEMGAATSQKAGKRKLFAVDIGDEETNTLQSQLIEVLEMNGRMVSEQLESQNTNFRLDREQRKDHVDSLVVVLNKLADALGRIADKL